MGCHTGRWLEHQAIRHHLPEITTTDYSANTLIVTHSIHTTFAIIACINVYLRAHEGSKGHCALWKEAREDTALCRMLYCLMVQVITSCRDRERSSTLVQGDQVTTHNTSRPAEPQHLEWEDCDLSYIHTCDSLGKVTDWECHSIIIPIVFGSEVRFVRSRRQHYKRTLQETSMQWNQ